MDQEFIDSLICPTCKIHLSLFRDEEKKVNVSEGLHCKQCNSIYPIINGIPRILTSEDLKALVKCGHGYAQIVSKKAENRIGGETAALEENNLYDYNYRRRNFEPVKFRLKSRAAAISDAMKELFPNGLNKILDLGSADGLLAKEISEVIPDINFTALDIDENLLEYNPFSSVQGNCCRIPFGDNTFDAATAAALIEHLPDPQTFLQECFRVIKPRGALILTCPAPFFDWLATVLGKDAGHLARYGIHDLQNLFEKVGFKNVYAKKFMLSPVHIPGHLLFESFLRKTGLSFLMLNQVTACIKK